jgi:acyl transferase domain-containing protein
MAELTTTSALPADTPLEPRVRAALRAAAGRLEAARLQRSEPLAVIGMACRFPQAASLADFWQLLAEGRDAITAAPPERWDSRSLQATAAKARGRLAFTGGGFLADVDRFDCGFFEISHREARSLDPQQRLLLEIAWETLEHAGIAPATTAGGRHGVFAGICSNDYLLRLAQADLAAVDPYFSTGNAHGTAAGRVAYFLRWQGPALAIDTACSSSLVAVHLAMQSLHDDECDTALALGVNLMLAPQLGVSLSQAGVLSPSGACRAFAAGADGFVRGEGCGGILLKRLSRARQDGDRIVAVLRGSAINQDGRSNGLTAPNGTAQQAVIRAALEDAGLAADEIDYVEAHGTGTPLGDPIEMHALSSVFSPRARPLRVGSVKTNIGHLEGAAGIAGLIKTCLALDHGLIPRHLHFDRPSEQIAWAEGFEIPRDVAAWERQQGRPRRAGVSSFGFGGTNAHVIVEEPPAAAAEPPGPPPGRECGWLKLSAQSPAVLRAQARRLAEALADDGTLAAARLPELVFAANVGRGDMACRAAVAAPSRARLLRGLTSLSRGLEAASGEVLIGKRHTTPTAVWVFPDLASRPLGETAERLAHVFPEFAAGWREIAAAVPGACPPAVFACGLQIALGDLWRSWDGPPREVCGEATGRIAAAVAAGLFSTTEGLRLAELVAAAGSRSAAIQEYLDRLPVRNPRCRFADATGADGAAASRRAAFWLDSAAAEVRLAEPGAGRVEVWFGTAPSSAATGDPGGQSTAVVPLLDDGTDAAAAVWTAVARAYVAGRPIDWQAALGPGRRTVSLPTYPFDRDRCWFDLPAAAAPKHGRGAEAGATAAGPAPDLGLLGRRLDLAPPSLVFESDLRQVPELADHRVLGRCTFPAAASLALAAAAAAAAAGRQVAVEDLRIRRGLTWDPEAACRIQVILAGGAGPLPAECLIAFQAEGEWRTHATCRVADPVADPGDDSAAPPPDEARAEDPAATTVAPATHYATCAAAGLDYGPGFRSLRRLAVRGERAWGEVSLPAADTPSVAWRDREQVLHPAILDGCLQGIVAVLRDEAGLWLPVGAERFRVFGPAGGDGVRFAVRVRPGDSADDRRADLSLWTKSGGMIAMLEGLMLRRAGGLAEPRPLGADGRSTAGPTDPAAVTAFVRDRVAAILECDPRELRLDTSLEGLGLDSMMILELLDDLEKGLGVRIPIQRFANGITLAEIAALGLETAGGAAEAAGRAATGGDDADAVEGAV